MARNPGTRRRTTTTVSWAALGLALASATAVQAQTAPPAPAQDPTTEVEEVVVTGTRASLQSAIERKRNANTTVDSIVAEDVSQFPDKNIGEALQRVTGVSLTRDLGEGSQISIRGVEPDLNRVEINGLSVLNNNGLGSRGASFQELASELVASIDVFKGFTADMTEGGVGGTVSIQTRRPLDLREPLVSLTASGQYFDLMESTKFRGNFTAGGRFLDNRFGAIVNITHDQNDTRGDFLRGTNWIRYNTTVNAAGAVTASGDYDNSPDRTFVHPDYADAAAKANCPTDSSTASGRTAIQTCLSQWNDYVPAIPRYGLWQREDERTTINLSTQYRVNDNLSLFADYTVNDRQQHLTDFNYTVAADAQSRLNAVTYNRLGAPITAAGTLAATVDDDHNVIGFNTAARSTSGTAGAANIFSTQNRDFDFAYRSQYLSGGFEWKGENLDVKGIVAHSEAKASSHSNSLTFNASIPNIRVDISDRGVPSFTFPTGYNPQDLATYATFANNGAGTNFATTAIQANYEPSETETFEDTVKLDVDYDVNWGDLIQKIEVGYQFRSAGTEQYSVGGYNMPDGTIVQGARARYNLVLSPTATGTGAPTFNPLTLPPAYTINYNAANLLALLGQLAGHTPTNFYSGASGDPGVTLPAGWLAPQFGAFRNAGFDLSLFDHDNLRRSPGYTSAGVQTGIFDQIPAIDVVEDVHAAYGQISWGTELFGMPFSGNAGVRYTRTELAATGAYLQRETIDTPPPATCAPLSPPCPPPGTTTTRNLGTTMVTLRNTYEDWLPTFNAALDITDELVARFGFARVMARPNPTFLVPAATCTFNRTATGVSDDELDPCTAGNPALEPYRANQYDLNLSWYRDRDTLVSVALFYKDVESFIAGPVVVPNVDLFGDGTLFNVTQRINGNGAKLYGAELSAQTAFTFLPAPFDGFGGIINYTWTQAKEVGLFHSLTLEELPFPGLSEHSYNLILYYDKGPINARLAYNARTEYLQTPRDSRGNPVFRDGTGYLDARAAYKFGPNLTVFAEARNLTGENERSTNGSIRLVEDVYSGKRYFVGLTVRY